MRSDSLRTTTLRHTMRFFAAAFLSVSPRKHHQRHFIHISRDVTFGQLAAGENEKNLPGTVFVDPFGKE